MRSSAHRGQRTEGLGDGAAMRMAVGACVPSQVTPEDDEEELKVAAMADMADIFSKVDKGGEGVCVQVREARACACRSHRPLCQALLDSSAVAGAGMTRAAEAGVRRAWGRHHTL